MHTKNTRIFLVTTVYKVSKNAHNIICSLPIVHCLTFKFGFYVSYILKVKVFQYKDIDKVIVYLVRVVKVMHVRLCVFL